MKLEYRDTSLIVAALQTAAQVYAADAKAVKASKPSAGNFQAAAQLESQSAHALELADKIEQAEGDTILPQCW